jgi:flavorubredoxin
MSAKVLIVYDSYTGRTGKMAEAVAEGARAVDGTQVVLKRAVQTTAQDLDGIAALVLGSPTRNTQVGPDMRKFLTLITAASDAAASSGKEVGGAFGSYGWSGEAAQRLEDALRGGKFRVVAPAVRCKLDPDAAGLQACRALGRTIALQAKESNP